MNKNEMFKKSLITAKNILFAVNFDLDKFNVHFKKSLEGLLQADNKGKTNEYRVQNQKDMTFVFNSIRMSIKESYSYLESINVEKDKNSWIETFDLFAENWTKYIEENLE